MNALSFEQMENVEGGAVVWWGCTAYGIGVGLIGGAVAGPIGGWVAGNLAGAACSYLTNGD